MGSAMCTAQSQSLFVHSFSETSVRQDDFLTHNSYLHGSPEGSHAKADRPECPVVKVISASSCFLDHGQSCFYLGTDYWG